MKIILILLTKIGISSFVARIIAGLLLILKRCEDYNKYKIVKLDSLSKDPKGTSICNNIIKEQNYDLQIIIPMYNVQDYICECIESVLQKTKYDVLICIINDGSTDNSRELIEKYAHIPNVLIIDQENRGFSGARNRGLEYIYGKYIMFVDSDDMLNVGAIDALMDEAINKGYDIVQGGYYSFIEKTTFKKTNPKRIYGMPWGKVYRAELFKDVKFPEKYWFEDSIISWIVLPKTTKVSIIKKIVYKYRKNFNGITVKSKGKYKNIDTLYITSCLLKDCKTRTGINQLCFERFLKQLLLNYKRVHSIKDRNIDYTVYRETILLYNKFFGSEFTTNNKDLKITQKALEQNNFSAYRILCTLIP